MGWNLLASLLNYWSFFSLVFVTVYGSTPKILSVTRSSDKGDSFEVNLESYGCPLCEQYGAVSGQTGDSTTNSGCFCHCDATKPTFYSAHSGQHSCVKDVDVLADTQGGDVCDFYTSKAQQLQMLDLHVGGKARLKPDDFCDRVQIAGWKFYFNASWSVSTSHTFATNSSKIGKNKLHTFLFWNDNLNSFYKGLLIKVMIRCTYRGKTDDRCLMLKAQGTHQYFEIPTTTPRVYEPSSSASIPTEKNRNVQKSTRTKPLPTGGYSKANNKQIWIAVSLGLSGLLLIVIIAIAVFLMLKCRRNCKPERTGSHHHRTEQPPCPTSTVCPPLHDYEYVHYPCLVEGVRSPPATPMGNPMYERGPDNKLIIWSPGHSGTLTRPSNSQSAEDMAPRLPYQRLLTRTSSSSPDCTAAIRPVSSPGVEEGFPYQKLVRAGRSLRRNERGCIHREESAAGLGGEGASTEAYQSLSLQRNPLYSLKECDGYAKVDGEPRPESTEYDYARVSVELDPVELNKLFRISHNDTEDTCMLSSSMGISIGDLDNTTSNPTMIQKRHSGVSEKYSTSSCGGDYENCTCKNAGEINSAEKDGDECVKPKGLLPAASYEDLSGGCRLDPEEYVEMGKRKSTMIVESRDEAEIEDGGPEYFVLEGLVESCEGETVDVP